jgi:carbon-monoxide dehydrogenase large subunit
MTAQDQWVGQSIERLEDRRLLVGAGQFADDFSAPGQLYCAILRSTHPHARITSINTSRANALNGVVTVLTGAEAKALWNPSPAMMELYGARVSTFYAMAPDVVVYEGEPIACVAAESRYIAEDALELIDVEYQSLPVIATMDAALGVGDEAPAVRLYDDWPDNVQLEWSFAIGDVDGAFERAHAKVLHEPVRAHRYSGVPLEARSVLADYNRSDNTLTVRASTQYPHSSRHVYAEAFGIPEANIRVLAGAVGGGYGNKQGTDAELIPILLSKVTGRPVKWFEKRIEWLLSGCGARDFRHSIDAAFDRDGRVLAVRTDLVVDVGCDGAVRHIGTAAAFVGATYVPSLYQLDAYQVRLRAVVTNKAPYGAYRGFGKEIANLGIERVMDAGARELGMDPIEIRRRNLIKKTPHEMCSGPVIESGDYIGCLERVVKEMDVEALRRRQREERLDGRYLGIGVITFVEPSSAAIPMSMFTGFETSSVRITPDGSALVLTGMQPIGQGTVTSVAQVAADRLGLTPADIRVVFGDTDAVPEGLGSYASRGASYGVTAVYHAASKVRGKMLKVAATMLDVPEDDLVVGPGGVRSIHDQNARLSVRQIARAVYYYPGARQLLPDDPALTLEGNHVWSNPQISWVPDEHGRMRLYPVHGGGAVGALVEVDIETGVVTVERMWIAHDAGKQINPAIVEGQIVGAVVQGLGGVLMEQLAYDKDARMLVRTLADYQLPNFYSAPPIEVFHLETPSTVTPLGSKGVGEAGAIGTPSAIMSAVEDALSPFGVKVSSSPLTPSRVFDMIAAAQRP